MNLRLKLLLLLVLLPAAALRSNAQIASIPPEYRGTIDRVARGVLDGNLIETNFRNHGELSRWSDSPWGVWPRGTGNRHIDGVALMVAGRVPANRLDYPGLFPNARTDTTVNPVILNYRDNGKTVGARDGLLYGWLPLPGFHNPIRRDAVTGRNEPQPAQSDDPTTWPAFWPDRLNYSDDPGWAGKWNGLFGKGVFNADLEAYYVMDDHQDYEYRIDPETGLNNSPYGVFYPDPQDSTMGGLGLRVGVRLLQWANILAEDVMFLLYEVNNDGRVNHDSLYFTNLIDYGFGEQENDGIAAFDPQLDIAYGWDRSGTGVKTNGEVYKIGYTGFAFLESPAYRDDGMDNDEDGIVDEDRFSGPGMLIEGRDAILAYVQGNYDVALFEQTFGPVTETAAYQQGYWWTGDENMNWRGFLDENNNGRHDEGELLFNDTGRDGLGPNDLGYVDPDEGEANGRPDAGEPNFDRLDIPESDQIGLTGFDLNTRPFYENGNNLKTDTWLWDRVLFSQFPLGTKPEQRIADVEPFLLFTSGPVRLAPGQTDFFSLAWVFGANRDDFYKNRRTVQNIYDANYNFAQPPFIPTLTAVPGDGEVLLGWDQVALLSFDRFTQEFDFEGFKLYKGTDPLLMESRIISDANGTPTFNKPIAQWDLNDGIRGTIPVLDNTSVYNLGTDNGLQFFYVDKDVKNGVRYYYALVAYDQGVMDSLGNVIIDPQENVFNFSVDEFSNSLGKSKNAQVVVPQFRTAGYVNSSTDQDLSRVTTGDGTGSIDVRVVIDEEAKYDNVYEITFFDSTLDAQTGEYLTRSYMVTDVTEGTVVLPRTPMSASTPLVDGFFIEMFNDELIEPFADRTGWVKGQGTPDVQYAQNAAELSDYGTDWRVQVTKGQDADVWLYTPDDYELRFSNNNVYFPPRFFRPGLIRDSINVEAWNVSKNRRAELLVRDINDSKDFDAGDELIIAERIGGGATGTLYYRWAVRFLAPSGAGDAPGAGNVVRISNRKPFRTGDTFRFELGSGYVDNDLARAEMDRIGVVPNPYIATSELELRTTSQARGDRKIMFIGLPQRCTIRIYNLRGELIRQLEHNSAGSDGMEEWDLRTRDNQDVAYGVYIYHVEAPDLGEEKTGKLALIK